MLENGVGRQRLPLPPANGTDWGHIGPGPTWSLIIHFQAREGVTLTKEVTENGFALTTVAGSVVRPDRLAARGGFPLVPRRLDFKV